jgi:hypothetical protein
MYYLLLVPVVVIVFEFLVYYFGVDSRRDSDRSSILS